MTAREWATLGVLAVLWGVSFFFHRLPGVELVDLMPRQGAHRSRFPEGIIGPSRPRRMASPG